ncbi:MAG: L-serine ammonia-lyase, iron-sulfur-dependent, subunit alpha [Firmicutes bacterium]|nr:L-serine ammonia-lyase, iron-sulfur-dependent, subunit alpha [Bacillota bacterium]
MSFTRLEELVELAESRHLRIAEVMIMREQAESGTSAGEILARMADQFAVMEEAARRGVSSPLPSRGGLIGGEAHQLWEAIASRPTLLGPVAFRAMAYAMGVSVVNAAMGRIVATPTAGAAGILPGVLVALLDTGQFTREAMTEALLTAAALGLVIANSASIAGASGGCQAEVGSATAMTAGTVVELYGGSPRQVVDAVGLALTNSLGLVCDPVAGLVEVPCLYRNGLHAVTALAAAECALAGVRQVIPPDEVVGAMRDIGNQLPLALRETGIGGLAGTPTGRRLRRQILGEDDHGSREGTGSPQIS